MSDHILTKKNAETVEMTEKCEIYSVSKKMSNTICCVGDDAMLLCYLEDLIFLRRYGKESISMRVFGINKP